MRQERAEADEAIARVAKEKAEFEKAVQGVEDDKLKLDRMIHESEKDGVVDDQEAAQIMKWKVELKIAEARLVKERAEFEEWVVKADKEVKEAEKMQERCEREITEHLANVTKNQAENEVYQKIEANGDAPGYSVLTRMEYDSIHQGGSEDSTPQVVSHNKSDDKMQLCTVYTREGSGYEGEWADRRPNGSGIETLKGANMTYYGQVS